LPPARRIAAAIAEEDDRRRAFGAARRKRVEDGEAEPGGQFEQHESPGRMLGSKRRTRARFRRPIPQAELRTLAARFAMPDAGRMPVSRDFLDHIADQLRGFGPVTVRPMFSGAGLFRDGLMFGLISRDVLHFKVGDANRGAYRAAGSKPFTYRRLGSDALLTSYYEVPAAVLDDSDTLVEWARGAHAAALAANAKAARKMKPHKTKRKTRKT
jgi:DNA transformation protein